MLRKSQSQCLEGCSINIHHLVHHLTVSRPFDKTLYPRTCKRVAGVDYNLQSNLKVVKIPCQNQFPQEKVDFFSPYVYAHVYPIIKTLISLVKL